jgi:hypothetical protein
MNVGSPIFDLEFFPKITIDNCSNNARCNPMRIARVFAMCLISTFVYGQTSGVSIQVVSNYNEWSWDSTVVMQNDCITLATVPAIGARVMQYDLGSIPSIMVNSSLFGQTPAPTNGGYYNFGGFKNWPSPQSIWNWPPPPTLDYGAYSVTDTMQTNDSVSVSVSSPLEKWRAPNIRFKRKATVYPGTSRVKMEQTIINEGTVSASWGLWDITQSIVNHSSQTDYQNYWAYFPLNPNSVLSDSGVTPERNSTAWKGEVAPGVYGVQFVPDNTKIFADPSKGWIAYASLSDTVVFAKTFPIFEGEQYPDGGARVTVYVSGNTPPLYMEVEVKGPVAQLAAGGGEYTFTEDWWAAKVRAPIQDVDSVGAIAGRLLYNSATQTWSADYGVFYQGTAALTFINAGGQVVGQGQLHAVTPLAEFQLNETMAPPDSAKTVEIRVCRENGAFVGILESSDISQSAVSVRTQAPVSVSEFRLEGNYPNPFNPSTTIRYALPQQALVQVIIYDIQGRPVRSFASRVQQAGEQTISWDGSDDFGNSVSSGTYIYRVKASSLKNGKIFDKSSKMILMK